MGNLRRGVQLGTLDVEYYLFTDISTKGWGAHMQNLTAAGTWTDELSHLHINVLKLRAVWLGLQAFCHKLDNATIALMSDIISAVAYLRNQGGGDRSRLMSDLAKVG